eukprot:922436_1
MKDVPANHYRQNLSQRIKNPKIYKEDDIPDRYGININVVDPESQNYPDDKYIKGLTNTTLSSHSFITDSTRTLIKKVEHQFDQFVYTLMLFGCISLLTGFFVLSWSGILVTTFAILACIGSFWYCSQTVRWIMSKGRGTTDMQIIAEYIKEGSDSYLYVQYKTIASIAIVTAIGLVIIYLFRGSMSGQFSALSLAIVTAVSFIIGAFCSAVAGYTGVWTSVRCNLRVAAAAANHDYVNAFLLAFRGGAVSAILSAAMCILGITTLYIISTLIFVRFMGVDPAEIPLLLGGYGFGASFVALFMQLGGGIYTKAADVGADMCGKIEQGIPEDDCRNPAVIADLVGDNVGDCAGSMADVFESIAAEMIGTMILGATLASTCKIESIQLYIFFPLIVHSLDLIVSIIGISLTIPRTSTEDAIIPMKRGYTIALTLAIILFSVVCRCMLHTPIAPSAWWHYALCGMVGLLCAYFIVLITQYYTDYTNAPVKKNS